MTGKVRAEGGIGARGVASHRALETTVGSLGFTRTDMRSHWTVLNRRMARPD